MSCLRLSGWDTAVERRLQGRGRRASGDRGRLVRHRRNRFPGEKSKLSMPQAGRGTYGCGMASARVREVCLPSTGDARLIWVGPKKMKRRTWPPTADGFCGKSLAVLVSY